MKIGIVIAVETASFLKRYSVKTEQKHGFTVFLTNIANKDVVAIESMPGEIYAACATQFLIDEYGVDFVINYGIVGSLCEEIKSCKTVFIEKLVHYGFDTSEADGCEVGRYLNYPNVFLSVRPEIVGLLKKVAPEIPFVVCASGDKFLGNIKEKEQVRKDFSADICEMESAGILLTCDRNDIPCCFIKTVADSLFDGAEEYYLAKEKASDTCLTVVEKLLSRL